MIIKGVQKIIFSLVIIMLCPAITHAENASGKNKAFGGTLVWGVYGQSPTIINPIYTIQSVSAPLESLIFNRLVRWNTRGEIEPDLAESWDISADGLIYTFHLRKGVYFHDGVECTAEDVKFTFDTIMNPQSKSPFCASLQLVREFKVIDRYTLQVILSKPCAAFLYRLLREIVPKHCLENIDLEHTPFNYHPIGTGPFKFREWNKDNQIILEYNPDYFEGRPYLDRIIVKVYADSRELWAALMRQEVDLVLFLEKDDYEILKKDPAFKTYAFAVDYYYAITYNLEDSLLSDNKIRQAIACAINRKSLIERVGLGYGVECMCPFYPESIGFNPDVQPIEYNPDKAAALLAEAGWKEFNRDGILEKDGQEMEIRMLVDVCNEVYRRMAMLIRQQLQEIGIKIVVQGYNDEKMLTREFLQEHKPQAQLKQLPTYTDPDQVEGVWLSKGNEKVYNLWCYKNPEVQRYFTLGKTAQDKTKRTWIYKEIHRFIYTEQPACFLYFPVHFHALSAKFADTDDFFSVNMPVHTIKDWWFDGSSSGKKERR